MTSAQRASKKEFLSAPWAVVVEPSENGDGYTAVSPDLPGIVASGSTASDAAACWRDLLEKWYDESIAKDGRVPGIRRGIASKLAGKKFSGRVMLRMPVEAHAKLAMAAAERGMTINAYCCAILRTTAIVQRRDPARSKS